MRPRNLLPHLVAVFLLSAGVYWLTSGVSAKPPVLQSLPVPSAALPAPPAAGELSPEARARQDREWGGFRLAFPFHIQVIAASDPYPDGTRTLIVSEPPPDATVDGLKALDAVALATAEVKTHTVGHDGWVKDVVFNVTAKQEELDRLVARLSKYLFETDYKAYCLKLPVNRESLRTKYPLDLRVGAAELKHWIDGRFTPVDGGAAAKGLAEMTAGQGGVFVSTTPGLVAWVIPPGVGLETRRADARRFAVDSDVIVGAVQTSNQAVVVLGRERIAPVDVMPPLRTETILLLASADTDQLAQSYERNAFFAGKFKGPWDWAPAYLSPQLIDTEYGSLLNIADQLLKSWTQHGELRYQNFPYPDPSPFPFEGPLARVLHAHSLLFNWNTTGAGFVVDSGRHEGVRAEPDGSVADHLSTRRRGRGGSGHSRGCGAGQARGGGRLYLLRDPKRPLPRARGAVHGAVPVLPRSASRRRHRRRRRPGIQRPSFGADSCGDESSP